MKLNLWDDPKKSETKLKTEGIQDLNYFIFYTISRNPMHLLYMMYLSKILEYYSNKIPHLNLIERWKVFALSTCQIPTKTTECHINNIILVRVKLKTSIFTKISNASISNKAKFIADGVLKALMRFWVHNHQSMLPIFHYHYHLK